MGRSSPKVMTGLRPSRADYLQPRSDSAQPESEAQEQVQTPADGTLYMSKYRSYRIQITSPLDVIDPATGQRSSVRPFAAQFADGRFLNNHRDPAMRELIDRTIRNNPKFGRFGSTAEVWLASEQNESLAAAKIESAKRTLKELPAEAVAAFLAELQQGDAEDHDLSAEATAQ